jgi:hypothetical protein
MLDWLGKQPEKKTARILMHLYHIWFARNDAREATHIEDPRRVAQRMVAALEEWNNI